MMKNGLLKNHYPKIENKLLNSKNRMRQYFLCYTVLFCVMFVAVFLWNFLLRKTFIWEADGWEQHYKAMIYFAQHVRKAVKILIAEHRIYFPEWDFALGEGSDILQALHFYVIGDPFALPCIVVPTNYMWIYYGFSIMLRLYAAGAAFSYLCFYNNKNVGRLAVMGGTLSYIFCSWAIYNANRHPFFLGPMVYLPLIVLGIEKIIKKEKPYVFIIAVFFTATSHFYFFYVIVCLTVVYALVRAVVLYKKEVKKIIGLLFRIGVFSVISVIMAAAIVIPVCNFFLSDSRMGSGNPLRFVYSFSYYSSLIGILFSEKDAFWLNMGFSCSSILGTVLLIRNRKIKKETRVTLKILLLICIVITVVPAFGQILNGFSYITNRWVWALAFLCAYISVVMWPTLTQANKKDIIKLSVFLTACFCFCLIFQKSRSVSVVAGIANCFLFIVVLMLQKRQEGKSEQKVKIGQAALLLVIILGIINLSYFKNSPISSDYYVSESVNIGGINNLLANNEAHTIKSIAKDDKKGFYRYSGWGLTRNAGALEGVSGTSYYWSVSNSSLAEYIREMELIDSIPQVREGYDDRAALLALSSVNYYAVYSKIKNPPKVFGYKSVDEASKDSLNQKAKESLINDYGIGEPTDEQIANRAKSMTPKFKIYRNSNSLPLGYSYENAIGDGTWKKLSALEKQEAMLQAVYIEGYNGAEPEIGTGIKDIEYELTCGDGVTFKDNEFVVTKDEAEIELNFNGEKESETYVSVHGLDYKALSEFDLYFGTDFYEPVYPYCKETWKGLSGVEKERIIRERVNWEKTTKLVIPVQSSFGVTKKIVYYTEDGVRFSGVHDFSANMGYNKEPIESLKITFPKKGIYTYDSLKVICQPMDNFESQIAALKQDKLTKVSLGTDSLTGKITLDKAKYLCLSIPYSKGWEAYVDGEKAEIYKANVKNMALLIDKGEHTVELKYHTPLLRYGILISAVGITLFTAVVLFDIIKTVKVKKRNKT